MRSSSTHWAQFRSISLLRGSLSPSRLHLQLQSVWRQPALDALLGADAAARAEAAPVFKMKQDYSVKEWGGAAQKPEPGPVVVD